MASGRGDSDDALALVRTADRLAVSEYRVFELAYRNWYGRVPEAEFLTQAYGRYLNRTELPLWVRDFTRRVDAGIDHCPLPVERPPLVRITVALAFVLAMAGIMVLLVLLALRAQEQLALNCALPPCY
jgi:hypothetical protein